ncbi:hypothetical protein BEWA_040120 [Theileria equi strain WA]|uniref:Uncharacterized protein n=1 Tax=Theileria equi strain WA TaxID=1537102 RepID=L1LFC1_THEEQ|nr:hypothetical protein BEWA_040120 [Theileria equi strain WA]EKX73974.1 hypothetical protein BEWA_040120 [Theileria equi strain WA]|eukprot:XP_004833426.1 hypothetical protein BEWA_040120 [Theileria equi strain WA]
MTSGNEPTRKELELLNCEINDVVQIDVIKTDQDNDGKYCHEEDLKHYENDQKKVKVEKVKDSGQLGNYVAYEHTPNPSGKFNISGFFKGYRHKIELKGLSLPIKDANRLVVYFCKGEVTNTTATNPLLIYVPDTSGKNRWFKKPESNIASIFPIWKEVNGFNERKESDYDEILKVLDTLNSSCKPPSVVIDIYQRKEPKEPTTYESSSTVEVKPISNPQVKGFAEYVHTIRGRASNYFSVKEFQYKSEKITEGLKGPVDKITGISVFYWTALETPLKKDNSIPLLVIVATKAPGRSEKITCYDNIGTDTYNTNWKPDKTLPPTKKALESKLKHLNCKLNNAVIIDVSQKRSPGNYDVCNDHYGGEKMQVKKDKISDRLGSYEVYTHKLKNPPGGKKFHVVSFKNGAHIITFNGLGTPDIPILDVSEVRVYFCPGDPEKPLLLYYKTGNIHNWYKNDNTAIKAGKWVYTGGLSNTDDATQYEKIRGVLNSLQSSCNPDTGGNTSSLVDPVSGGVLAGYIIPSVFGGSAATFFGGWKLYKNFKGDPWVR